MKIVSFLGVSLLLTGCLTTPGMTEPLTNFVCTIVDDKTMRCGPHGEVSITHGIGFSAISPEDAAAFLNHHDELHHRLNECEKK